MRRRMVAIAAIVTLFLLLGAIGITAGEAVEPNDSDIVYECAETPPDDFSPPDAGNETIGWVDGFWYNQPLDMSVDEGLTEDELTNLSARTAARVEAMRCLAFAELPPVEIIDRDEFAAETDEAFAAIGDAERMADNAQLQTMLLVGSDVDSIDVRAEDRTATVGGYYNFVENRTVVIADDPDTLQIDEEILAHELGHALQDQHFDLTRYERPTKDMDAGKLGMIEGDVHRIEQEYLRHCEDGNWSDPCVTQEQEISGGVEPANWGLYFANFQPYSDGPSFVETIYDDGGWEAVNAVYEDMPVSSHQVIYPDQYQEYTEQSLFVPDRSTDDWERLSKETSGDYNVIGQAAMSAMFMGPAYDDGDPRTGPVVTQEDFLNIDDDDPGMVDASNPINYDLPQTDGWQADRMYSYTNGDDVATVWKTSWENTAQMESFKEAYAQLLEYHGGELSETYEYTWTFDPQSEFNMAVTLASDGDQLKIVTAPTVSDLEAVQTDLALEPIDTDDTNGDFPPPGVGGNTDDTTGIVDDDDHSNDDMADDIIPGFGPIAAIVSLFLAGIAARTYRT